MKAQHTKGPWTCCQAPDSDLCYHVADEDGCVLTFNSEEHDANARLIAAAPDLLDALEKILRAHKSGNNGAYMGEASLCTYFEKMAEQAVTKARGESC